MTTQEPIVWYRDEDGIRMYFDAPYFDDATPLYSAQREWVGLTEEEINEVLGGDIRDEPSGELRFIRAIEAKLKEKNT